MTDQAKDGTKTALMSREHAAMLERVVVGGDLSKLSAQERMSFYVATCQSVGLNPITRPFEFLYLQGKMVMYARKEATDQLRALHGVSVTSLEQRMFVEETETFVSVIASGKDKTGREDIATGVVALRGRGDERANCYLKAETKAKRRLTLSLCGLGMLDESEIDVTPAALTATETVTVSEPGGGIAGAVPKTHEMTTLFPTPEADRAGLISRARIATARLDKTKAAAQKAELFGSAEAKYEDVDLAALVGYVQWAEQPL